ncbi:hypothetical protein NYE80_03585 [Paenibacillus sp. FSL H7-0357]|uniref:hypothetical protein n=1 Tax=Paenibacillus sp. FSL H7-0357 TaxID=1536774 RepID=UPI0012E08696|nr:hypothetical protein [Paenibacillus sp. FSL H7-0357]
MEVKASNNRLPKIHPMVTPHYGENYWFNGCAGFVMECLGEPDYDYWFFAGPFTQSFQRRRCNGLLLERKGEGFIEDVFEKCGYASSLCLLSRF